MGEGQGRERVWLTIWTLRVNFCVFDPPAVALVSLLILGCCFKSQREASTEYFVLKEIRLWNQGWRGEVECREQRD